VSVLANGCGGKLTPGIPVALYVPIGVRVRRVVVFCARHFDLLESPLGQDRVGGAQVTPKSLVSKP
jgi:hypothetical protein